MKIVEMKPRYPVLSYLELETWVSILRPSLEGARVDRIFVPEFSAHPESYFKRVWVMDLHSAHQSYQLVISLRSQECGIFLLPPKTLRPAKTASRSGFDLGLSKSLAGTHLRGIESVQGDRVVILRFHQGQNLSLHLHLIPARPLGALLEGTNLLQATDQRTEYQEPSARELSIEQIKKIPNRPELLSSIEHYSSHFTQAFLEECLGLRAKRIEQKLRADTQAIESKIKSLQEQKTQSELEPDWNYFGSLLQIHFYQKPKLAGDHYELLDYEKDETIKVPADPKLDLKAQLERYFHLAKRKKKRLTDSEERLDALSNKLHSLRLVRAELEGAQELETLEQLDSKLGFTPSGKPALQNKDQKKLSEFSGKQYRSKEGLTILVGRSLSENLELTFKIARGNDLWLHVKGRPGSHAVILLPPKRTASLDTLLDAAQLCLLHSGGKEWGKTEVDYTHRKHVKKIKNQTEVSYTHNKTLTVSVEEERIKRLYENES